MKIGVIVDSFRLPLKEGLLKAKEVGAGGVQIYAVSGEMDPDNLPPSARRELKEFVRSLGLEISALCGDLGGHGFAKGEELEWRIVKSKQIIDLAVELDTSIVTTHIGVISEDTSDPAYGNIKSACEELAAYGDRVGATFAVETGPEPAVRLKRFLDGLGHKGVRVNLDPANLVMVTGDDPVEATYLLRDYIVHTHAKDGIMLKRTDPKLVYDYFAEGGIEDIRLEEYFKEVPLGQGQVDFDRWLRALKDIGYDGFLTIEREVGEDPAKDIEEAVRFLRGKIKEVENEGR
ncbi:MAG TPA: sugar phosphate isomerase/epimerase [Candidatus Latescibacteria bacterium]|nr:sugar phosphate isomerase/epimerase [Candidatus Latescibacterota bacterium]